MHTSRIIGLCVFFILFFIQGQGKSTKSIEDYHDDPPNDYDYDDESEDEASESTGPSPRILTPSSSISALVGETVILPCKTINEDGFAVMWERNNSVIKIDTSDLTGEPERIQVLEDHSLKIKNVTLKDSHKYNCSVSVNKGPSVVHKLTVFKDIYPIPSDKIEVTQGELVKLGCHTNLTPPPKMKWFRKDKRVDSDMDNEFLTIHKINRHQGGLYQCLADAGQDNPPLAGVDVTVRYPPEVEAESEMVHSGTGIESELTCIVHAHPHARVTWYKDGKEIPPKAQNLVTKNNKSKHSLKIYHTTDKDFGKYTCAAKNELGESKKIITLTGAPSAPTIHGGELTDDDTTILLKWHLKSDSPIIEYKLEYQRVGDGDWKTLTPNVTNGKGNQYTVQHPIAGLQPGSYIAVLRARNSYGWSPPSEPHEFTGDYGEAEGTASVTGSGAVVEPLLTNITLLLFIVSLCTFRNI